MQNRLPGGAFGAVLQNEPGGGAAREFSVRVMAVPVRSCAVVLQNEPVIGGSSGKWPPINADERG
jgi:hypothetical protein